MKGRIASKLGTLALGVLWFTACGGAAETNGNGAAAGAPSTAGAPSSAGAPSFAGSGAASNGGAGTSSGCVVDSDCVECAFNRVPQSASDCYCALCASTALSKAECASNQAAWQAVCSGVRLVCPAIACVQPQPAICQSNGVCSNGIPK